MQAAVWTATERLSACVLPRADMNCTCNIPRLPARCPRGSAVINGPSSSIKPASSVLIAPVSFATLGAASAPRACMPRGRTTSRPHDETAVQPGRVFRRQRVSTCIFSTRLYAHAKLPQRTQTCCRHAVARLYKGPRSTTRGAITREEAQKPASAYNPQIGALGSAAWAKRRSRSTVAGLSQPGGGALNLASGAHWGR